MEDYNLVDTTPPVKMKLKVRKGPPSKLILNREDESTESEETCDGTESDKDSCNSGGSSSDSDDEWIASKQKLREMSIKFESVGPSYLAAHAEQQASDSENSENLYALPTIEEEDEIDSMKENVHFKVLSDAELKSLVWRVGMQFASPQIFKGQVIRYAVVVGYSIRWYKSEKNNKLAARCKQGCIWKIYASWDGKREKFVVKSVTPDHTCNRQDFENIQVKAKWLAKEYLEQYRKEPSWSTKALIDAVMARFGVQLKRFTCYRVRNHAHRMIYGIASDHYNKVGSYLFELQKVDPLSTINLLTEKPTIPTEPEVFRRLYVSFPALREGFLKGCRPMICLDGCFLKTYLGGMLLCAVGRDGNNQMYPIAWAIVEAENNESWSWFLENLKKYLKVFGGEDCTISSDQQKGLCNAVQQHFPAAEHRNCARHIYANWHKKHKGDHLKLCFWKAARAYKEADLNIALHEMRLISNTAAEDFLSKNPKRFCRAYLKTMSKCDVIVNNLAKTFNGYILGARSKPLIYMLEDIRLKVMERLFTKSSLMASSNYDICPRIRRKLEIEKEEARNCKCVPSSTIEFQVICKSDMFSVNFEKKICSCRKWDLSGIPCCHAISYCNFLRVQPENLVFDWFKKEKYIQSYKYSIKPVKGEKHWEPVDHPLDPPSIKVSVGRPKKNRRQQAHERFDKKGKLSRHGTEMTCQLCKGKNHNKRTCPQKDKMALLEATPIEVRPRGRPRKDGQPPKRESEHSRSMTNQPSKSRGRPRKAPTISMSETTIPNGFGVFFGGNQEIYINPGITTTKQPNRASQALTSAQRES